MAKNLNLFFDSNGSPRARGPSSEKLLMAFLEADVQGSDHICHDLMDDVTAIEDKSAESREFIGNAHSVVMTAEGVTIECIIDDVGTEEATGLEAHNHPHGHNEKAQSEETQSESHESSAADSSTRESDKAIQNAGSGTVGSGTYDKKKFDGATQYQTGLKHFREVLEDWEAFILDDQSPA